MAQRPGRSRCYCLTINNWTETDYKLALLAPTRYIIIGRERSENNTPHLQIYLEMKNPISFDALKEKYFPRAHIEPREGTQQQARKYCTKEHYHEYGNFVIQGKRNDLTIALELLDTGTSIRTALDTGLMHTLGTLTAYERLQKYYVIPRTRPRVFWIYGPGGSGKTDRAYQLVGHNDVFKVDLFTKGWYDGYDRHRAIILDDLEVDSADQELFRSLLALLDKNPLRLNVKNSSASLAADTIIITSQKAPWHIWNDSSDRMSLSFSNCASKAEIERSIELRQIMRRITEVIHLSGDNINLNYPIITEE